MVILALIASVVAPNLGGVLPSVKVSRTAQEFAAAAGKARADAAITGRRHRLVIDKAPKDTSLPPSFQLEYEPDPLGNPATWWRLQGWKVEMPDGVGIDPTSGFAEDPETTLLALEFRPDGTSEDAVVTFSHERGDTMEVHVAASDGRARMVDPLVEAAK